MLGSRAQHFLEYHENPSRGPGQAVQPGTAAEQDCVHYEMLSRGFGKGAPRKQTHQNKLVITRECISEASARGVSPSWSPKEMLQNKIVLFRVLARVPPGKAPEQDCYYQEMPSRSFGQGVPLGKAPEQDSDYQDKL